MLQITLTPEQAQVVATALKPVEVRDADGQVLGHIQPVWTEKDVEEATQDLATNQEWYTTEQVLAHLKSLERQ
jgi:hypothetical protein